MKRILGSMLLLTLSLWGRSVYHWDVSVDNPSLFLHEATQLTMKCVYEKEGKNDDVEFSPPKNVPFEFKLLREDRSFIEGRQHIVYEYLLFARAEGNYSLKVEPKMLFTTQSAINNIIIGRDNVNDLEVEKEVAQIDPIEIQVKGTQSDFAGRFTLTSTLDQEKVSAFEPVHLELRIKGQGNMQDITPFNFAIEGVEVFVDEPEVKMVMTPHGYEGEWVQRFAFVGEKAFEIPAITLQYFDLDQHKQVYLQTQSFTVQIKSDGLSRASLVDDIDSPSTQIKWSEYLSYLYYGLSFIFGFMVAKLVRLPKRKVKNAQFEALNNAKTAKELMNLLLQLDHVKYANEIEQLETAVYAKASVDLTQIKKRVKKKA